MSGPSVQKLPLTFHKLQLLWPVIISSKNSGMWQALISLAFYAGLRCSEYTQSNESLGPTISQVSFMSNQKVLVYNVTSSKTKIHGFQCHLGCSTHAICAYCTIKHYLANRSSIGQCTSADPLFLLGNKAVGSAQVNRFIKAIVSSLGWDPAGYSAHSLRAGAATTAAQAGFNEWELKALGGWSSSTYQTYIRDTQLHTAKFPRRLARGTKD